MFRFTNNNPITRTVAACLRLTPLLTVLFTFFLAQSALAQTAEPRVKPVAPQPESKADCNHGSGPKRFFFQYSNGDFDSGTWTGPMEIMEDDLSCLTFEDGDTDFDAAEMHLSCSLDYDDFPEAVGNGLTVVNWSIYRPGSGGGVCGDIPFPGHLIITKQTIPDGDGQSFSFNGDSPIGSFSLSDGQSQSFFVDPGTYDVTETEPTGWDLTGLVCDDPTGDTTTNLGNATASAALGGDETVSCTFTNSKVATITIEKVVTFGSQSQPFGFSGDLGGFQLTHGDSETFQVDAGTYTVNETVPTGWTLDDAVCDDDGQSDPRDGVAVGSGEDITCTFSNSRDRGTIIVRKQTVPDEDPNSTDFGFTGPGDNSYNLRDDGQQSFQLATGNYAVSESGIPSGWELTGASCTGDDDGSDPSSIQLDKNETVTCTFTNTQRGRIIIAKETLPDGAQRSFSFSSDYGAGFGLSDGQSNDSGFLSPGDYSATESVPNGWALTSVVCDDNDSGRSGNSAEIGLQPGEVVTCTFTNTQDGDITIVKQTTPDGSDKSFDFVGDLGGFSLMDGGSNSSDVAPGQYTVSEVVPYGWNLDSIVCVDSADQDSSGSGNTANINLQPGESVECTFNNVELDAGIAVLKLTNGDESNPGECTGVLPDATVNWSYQVTNTGDVPVAINEIVDDAGTPGDDGDNFNPSFDGGDTNGNGLLDVGETWSYSASGTGAFQGDGEYVNTVTVNGEAAQDQGAQVKVDLGDPVSASDQSCYETPGIQITKDDGGITVPEEQSFSYTLSYQNTGGQDLSNVVISDTVPANTTFSVAGSTTGWSCADGAGPGTLCEFSVGSLPVGGNGSVQFGLTVDDIVQPDEETGLCPDPLPEPVIDNTGDIVGTGGAGDVDDSDSDDTPVEVICDDVLASITVIKQTLPEGSQQSFEFSGSAGIGAFTLNGDGDSETFSELEAGDYSVSENVPEGWELTGTECSNGDDPSSITVGPGDSVSCTFTNTQDGTITIVKETDPSGSQQVFDFSGDLGNFQLADGQSESQSFQPGTYGVSETVPEGWTQTSATCSDESDPSAIDLGPGEDVTCTFVNTQDGTITIVKETIPEGSEQLFDFSGDLGDFQLAHGQSESQDLEPGTYGVSESVPAGWTLDSATCSDQSDPSSIELGAGEEVTCTFVNRQLDAGLDVLKLTNGNPGDGNVCDVIPVGDDVNWTYDVSNPGEQPLSIDSIVDDNGTPGDGGDDFTPTFVGGDANGNDLLDPEETWSYEASGTAIRGEYTNTVTVNGTVQGTAEEAEVKVGVGEQITATDTSGYCGEEVDLAIEKTDAVAVVVEGADFAYTLAYENLGNVDVTGVVITETVPVNTTFNAAGPDGGLWNCADDSAGSTCTHQVGALAAGASGSVQFPLTVDEIWAPDEETGECGPNPEPPPVTNTGSIADDGENGEDSNPGNNEDSEDTPITVSCDDEEELPPEIQIVKDPPSQLIEQGESASFTITVTNPNEFKLVNVKVTDPRSPDCNRNIGDMEPGAVFAYDCERSNVQGNFTNVADVTGEDEEGNDVSDEDDAIVNVLSVDEPEQAIPIPTLSQWALILMAGLMLLLGGRRVRVWTRR